MSRISVAGNVIFKDGGAILEIRPQPHPDAPEPAVRPDISEVLQEIQEGKVDIHPSRRPLLRADVNVIFANIQRSLKLKVGASGGWSSAGEGLG